MNTSIFFWLKNRAKEVWREKQVMEFETLPDHQLDLLIEKINKAHEKAANQG